MKPINPVELSLRAQPVVKKPVPTNRVPVLSSNMPSRIATSRAAFRSTVASTEQRKRSQRVLLRVGANIHVELKGKLATLETTTVSVHPEGALVLMRHSLPPDTKLILEHKGTREKVSCRVAKAAREMSEGFHVAVEFDTPAPDFWKIAFPPTDWHPEDQ